MNPQRDDEVAVWLKARRDQYERHAAKEFFEWAAWNAIDDLLDEWRQRADTGADLLTPMPEEDA